MNEVWKYILFIWVFVFSYVWKIGKIWKIILRNFSRKPFKKRKLWIFFNYSDGKEPFSREFFKRDRERISGTSKGIFRRFTENPWNIFSRNPWTIFQRNPWTIFQRNSERNFWKCRKNPISKRRFCSC